MDTQGLIRLARKGDLKAYNQLVLEHQEAAYNLACWMLLSEESAAEATQEAFLHAFRDLSRYREGSFRAWILQRVARACRMRTAGPAGAGRINGSEVNLRLSALPSGPRLALVLVDWLGLDYNETAAVMDIPPESVRSSLTQARLSLLSTESGALAAA
jgi:RNA polymerase sigma-70 factor (ECF subfamily)